MATFAEETADPRAMGGGEHALVAAQVRAASTSFYWAMRLLPPHRRQAIFAVYAFCRAVDDVVDAAAPPAQKAAELDGWRQAIAALYDGRPDHAITRALAPAVLAFELRRQDFDAIIAGMAMDAGSPVIAPDWAMLDLYCDRVAAAVGRLCVRIFGEPGATGLAVADALGRALQLANILRDAHEDAERGRLYVPCEILAAHGILARAPRSVVADPSFPAAWRTLAGAADKAFADAAAALARCHRRKMRPARVMMEVYRRNLRRMIALSDREIADPGASKRLVGKAEKLLIALRYGIL